MKYITTTIEPSGAERTARILYEHAQGGRIYRRPDGSHVIVRPDDASWPPYSAPLDAPADLAAAGWVEVL
jgi:hypothetical protein